MSELTARVNRLYQSFRMQESLWQEDVYVEIRIIHAKLRRPT